MKQLVLLTLILAMNSLHAQDSYESAPDFSSYDSIESIETEETSYEDASYEDTSYEDSSYEEDYSETSDYTEETSDYAEDNPIEDTYEEVAEVEDSTEESTTEVASEESETEEDPYAYLEEEEQEESSEEKTEETKEEMLTEADSDSESEDTEEKESKDVEEQIERSLAGAEGKQIVPEEIKEPFAMGEQVDTNASDSEFGRFDGKSFTKTTPSYDAVKSANLAARQILNGTMVPGYNNNSMIGKLNLGQDTGSVSSFTTGAQFYNNERFDSNISSPGTFNYSSPGFENSNRSTFGF